jgi:hypothetical protein
VEEKGGEPTVRARFAGGHFAPLRGLVTSMLLFMRDELPVTLSYQGVSAESAAPLPGAGPVPYIWRILLILYILQLLIILFTLPGFNDAVKRVPQGTLVKVELKPGHKPGGKEKREIEAIAVKRKITLGDTLIPMRLLPFIGLLPPFWRKDVTVPGVQMMTYDAQSDSVVLTCTQNTKGTFLVAPDGFAEWARKSSLGKSMDDDKFRRARVECEPKTTNESKKLSLTVSSGPVVNDVLYVFVKRGR